MIRIIAEPSPDTFTAYELPTAVDLARPLTQDEAWAVLEAAFVATGRWLGILPGLTIELGTAVFKLTTTAETLGVSLTELESWIWGWHEDERTDVPYETTYIPDLVSIGGGALSPTEVLRPYRLEGPFLRHEELRGSYPAGELIGDHLEPHPLPYWHRFSRL